MMLSPTNLSEEREGKKSYWKSQIAAWQLSGLTAKAYCEKNSLIISQFKYWQYRLAPETKRNPPQQRKVKASSISFMELIPTSVGNINKAISSPALKLHFANGTDMEVYQALPFEHLIKLIEQLG